MMEIGIIEEKIVVFDFTLFLVSFALAEFMTFDSAIKIVNILILSRLLNR